MMMMMHKKFILLRQKGDESEFPFNLRNYQLYEYRADGSPELEIWNPANNQFEQIDFMLSSFVRELESDPAFATAKDWIP